MANVGFKDLPRRTVADKVLRDEAFNIAKNPKYDEYQRGLASMVYKFIDKKSPDSGFATTANKSAINNKNMSNLELAEELHKSIIRKFEKRKVHLSFKENLDNADLADMQLTSKFDKGTRFLLCVIDIFHGLFP